MVEVGTVLETVLGAEFGIGIVEVGTVGWAIESMIVVSAAEIAAVVDFENAVFVVVVDVDAAVDFGNSAFVAVDAACSTAVGTAAVADTVVSAAAARPARFAGDRTHPTLETYLGEQAE